MFPEHLCEKVGCCRKVCGGFRGGDGPLAIDPLQGPGLGFPFHTKLAEEVVGRGFNDALRIVDSSDVKPRGFSIDGHSHVGLACAQPDFTHEHVTQGDGFLAR